MPDAVTPYEVRWTSDQVEAMLAKVAAVRLPTAPTGAGWSIGCDADFLERFRQHWLHAYDWRAAMATLNRYPQFMATIDGHDIHFVHIKGEGASPRPLLLTHGWPGSHYEFWAAAERLAFPSRDGGSVSDAFDLVIPSLPGYAFSGKPAQPVGPKAVAALWNRLMTEVLGYEAYLAQGGDWGGVVTSFIGLNHGEHCRGIHLNLVGLRSAEPPQNEAETAWGAQVAAVQQRLGGYAALQMMKPMSLALVSADNPLGQAAWILERFHDWAQLDGREVDQVFGMDHLITNVMLYVMTGSFATSVWFYNGLIREGGVILPKETRCETPTAFANFPADAVQPNPPRSRVELVYNLVRWSDPAKGGHFAAMEQPWLFADDVAEWGAVAWPS
jgi:pimeloyl-ACP methyl ester carboxylesterase